MADHEGDYRGYTVTHEAWYWGALNKGDIKAEMTFGLYGPEGGTSGEMVMRWSELGDRQVPRLEVFDDAWSALATMPELIQALGAQDNKNTTPREFAALLGSLGFIDRTERRQGEQTTNNPYKTAIRAYLEGLDAKHPGAIMWDLEQALRRLAE